MDEEQTSLLEIEEADGTRYTTRLTDVELDAVAAFIEDTLGLVFDIKL